MIKKTIPILMLLTFNLALAQGTATSSLPGYISNVFTWSLRIGGLIAFGALVFGGFKYLTSAGNPQQLTEAKSYITGAIIGLVLLLGSFLLLRTINPALVGRKTSWVKPDHGVCFYTQGGAEGKPSCSSDNSKNLTIKAESVEFESTYSELKGIYLFPQQNWEGGYDYKWNNRTSYEDSPDVKSVNNPQSFYLDWNTPGIYLYKKTDQEPDFPNQPFKIYQTNAGTLGNYLDEVKSVRFENSGCKEKNGVHVPETGFAGILHSETGYEGQCTIIGIERPSSASFKMGADYCRRPPIDDLSEREIGYNSASLTTFNYSFLGNDRGEVTFYDQTYHQGDHFTVSASQISDYWHQDFDSYPITSAVNVQEGEDPIDNGEMENIHSIKIRGKFLVVIGRDQDFGEEKDFGPYCEVTKKDKTNLPESYVLQHPWDARINSIGIIPVK